MKTIKKREQEVTRVPNENDHQRKGIVDETENLHKEGAAEMVRTWEQSEELGSTIRELEAMKIEHEILESGY